MLIDNFFVVLRGITKKKMRTFLTILGITIGITSVTIIMTIISTGEKIIKNQLDSIGMDSTNIVTTESKTGVYGSLNQGNISIIKNSYGVDDCMPILAQYSRAKIASNVCDCLLWGIGENADDLVNLKTIYGRAFNKDDIDKTTNKCIVDEEFSKKYYNRTNIVGKKIKILLNGKLLNFDVIGVVKSQSSTLNAISGGFMPHFLYIPYTSYMKYYNLNEYDQVVLKIDESFDVEKISNGVIKALESSYGVKGTYGIFNVKKTKGSLEEIMNIISLILIIIASISLIVSSLMIIITMVTSVSERTKEIGVKKAIGATKLNIVTEFLMQSIIITFLGVISGIILGIIICYIASMIFNISIVININYIILCLIFSLISGIIFGVVPAIKASNLDPINALRYE